MSASFAWLWKNLKDMDRPIILCRNISWICMLIRRFIIAGFQWESVYVSSDYSTLMNEN